MSYLFAETEVGSCIPVTDCSLLRVYTYQIRQQRRHLHRILCTQNVHGIIPLSGAHEAPIQIVC